MKKSYWINYMEKMVKDGEFIGLTEELSETVVVFEALLVMGHYKSALNLLMDQAHNTPEGMAQIMTGDEKHFEQFNFEVHGLIVANGKVNQIKRALRGMKEDITPTSYFCIKQIIKGDEDFIGAKWQLPHISMDERVKDYLSDVYYG